MTKMGSIFGHAQNILGFVFGLFFRAKRHGKDAKREARMIGDRAPFPRYHA